MDIQDKITTGKQLMDAERAVLQDCLDNLEIVRETWDDFVDSMDYDTYVEVSEELADSYESYRLERAVNKLIKVYTTPLIQIRDDDNDDND